MCRNFYSVKLISSNLEIGPSLSGEIQRQLWWGVYSDNFIPFALEIGTRRLGHKIGTKKIGIQKLGYKNCGLNSDNFIPFALDIGTQNWDTKMWIQKWSGVYSNNFIPFALEIGTQKLGHKIGTQKLGYKNGGEF